MNVKVTLRSCARTKGRSSYYLDFYPAVIHQITGKPTRRQFLNLYKYDHPQNEYEEKHNEQTLKMAQKAVLDNEVALNKGKIKPKKIFLLKDHINKDFENYKSPGQMSRLFRNQITKAQFIFLAENSLCPYYIFINPATKKESYYFNIEEVKVWLVDNCIKKSQYMVNPVLEFREFNVSRAEQNIPLELSGIKDIYEIPLSTVNTPPGIYFLCLNGKIQYIGQAINVANRILTHLRDGIKDFDSIYFIVCSKHRLNEVEAKLINKYNPPLNKVYPKINFESDN